MIVLMTVMRDLMAILMMILIKFGGSTSVKFRAENDDEANSMQPYMT